MAASFVTKVNVDPAGQPTPGTRTVVVLRCDGCRATGTVKAPTIDEARRTARIKAGWVSQGGEHDWCPACSAKESTS